MYPSGTTGIFLVPAQCQAVCAEQKANPRQLKLRVLSWGAAPASDTLLRSMSETFPGTRIESSFELGDLDEFLTERLARYKHPKHLVVDALPRNRSC